MGRRMALSALKSRQKSRYGLGFGLLDSSQNKPFKRFSGLGKSIRLAAPQNAANSPRPPLFGALKQSWREPEATVLPASGRILPAGVYRGRPSGLLHQR
jgi:hypothetical protein